MREQLGDPGVSEFDNDYQVIRLSITWGATSVGIFVVVLGLQVFGRALGVSLAQVIGASFALAVAGLALGLIGLRFGRSRGAARAGAFLNGVVVGIFVLAPVAAQILRWLG